MGETKAPHRDAYRFGPAAPDENCIYGACAPGWHTAADHETAVDAWISDMKAAGIERVCCLVAATQSELEQTKLQRYRMEFGDGSVLHAATVRNRLIRTDVLTDTVLPFLSDAADASEPTVVHGLSGLGRTGQVLAAWLVYDREYHPARALETVTECGRDPYEPVRESGVSEEALQRRLGSVREDHEFEY